MLSKNQKKIAKIVIFVLILIILALGVEYLIEYFTHEFENQLSFFARHFTFGIMLMLVGAIAFMLPLTTRTRYGEGKGDNLMIIVAILLVLAGIVTIGITFILK